MDTVPLRALRTTAAGVRIWDQYTATGVTPTWEQLSQCELWTETYSGLHSELSGRSERRSADKETQTATAKGQVHQATVALSTAWGKMFRWGPLLEIVPLCQPDIIWVECAPRTGCSNEVTAFLRQNPNVTVIAMGDMYDVNSLIMTLDHSEARRQQSHTFLTFSLATDSAFSPNKTHHKDNILMAFILTPLRRLNPHHSILHTLGSGWSTVILDYCLYIINLQPEDQNRDQHLIYVPSKLRSAEDYPPAAPP